MERFEDEIMDLADFISADPEQQDESWKITNDLTADWAVQRINEEEAEYFRLNALAHDRIAMINQEIEDAERRFNNRTSYLKAKLFEYFEQQPHRQTKTQEQYRLLSGTLVYTKPKETVERESEEELLTYLKESGFGQFIKLEEKPMWGDFKKILTVVDGNVINTVTGEIVPGVKAGVKEASFDVKGGA